MVLRVNDPDKLYPQGTMQAAKDAEKRFRAPVARPANTGRSTTLVGNRTSPGLGPVRQSSRVQPPQPPDLITYETNPNIDAKTAQAINTARIKGYQDRLGNVQQAQSALENTVQQGRNSLGVAQQAGRNQLATTGLSNQGAMARQVVSGAQAKDRLGIANQFTGSESEKNYRRELEKLGVLNTYDSEAANRKAGVDYILGGGNPQDATSFFNAGQFGPDLTGVDPITQPAKPPTTQFIKSSGGLGGTELPPMMKQGNKVSPVVNMSSDDQLANYIRQNNPRMSDADIALEIEKMRASQDVPK